MVAFAVRFWMSSQKTPEMPKIPTVNLDGVDPAISQLVQTSLKSLQDSPNSGMLWGRYAMVLHANGFDDEAALVCYDAAANLEPKNPKWPYLRADLTYAGSDGPGVAITHFEVAAKLSPPDSLAQLRFANNLLELGRLDDAEQEFRKVLAVRSSDPYAQLGLGRVAVARRQYREALSYLQPATEHSLVQNKACTLLISIFERLGDRASADLARKRLATMPPDQPKSDDPINELGQYTAGMFVELKRAQALRDQGRVSEMMEVVEATVHRYPEAFEAWAALSNAYGLLDNPAGAEKAARKGVQLASKNSNAWLSLGNVLIWRRRFQEAVEPLKKSIELNPQNVEAHISLGECWQNLGDSAAAADAYRTANRLAPDHLEARRRLEELKSTP
ncbi:MAG: tetratricopeptide repeat protein [Pirellulaceae bacterium]